MPAEAWSDGSHVVRLWLSSVKGVAHVVQYGRADRLEYADHYTHEGDARARYESLVRAYQSGDPSSREGRARPAKITARKANA